MKYEDFRREYTAGGLDAAQLRDNPMQQFDVWMQQAIESQLIDPTAMVLGTVNEQGQPWQRIVLCKGVDESGFTFYTNYESEKARAIEAHNQVSVHFPWNALDRQVIVAGAVTKIEEALSAAYFASRPRASQIAAWASRQSEPLADRASLDAQVAQIEAQFADVEVPLPPAWGGYRVIPHTIEFWQGRENRLHDRFRYQLKSHGQWEVTRLQP